MPLLGADMEAGTIVEWRVDVGDVVHRGDIVALVDTEKSTIEVEVFEDGVIEEILVPPGVEVPVGTALARVRPVAAVRAPEGDRFVRASPRARRLAADAGVTLAGRPGSGPGGALLATDVTTPPATPPEPPEPAVGADDATRRRLERRHAVGALMARSAREIPHYYLATTIDLGTASQWLADVNSRVPASERLLPAALLLRAVAVAAAETAEMNGHWIDDEFHASSAVDLGVAVALRGGGLVAPSIKDANELDLRELMSQLRGLVQRARSGVLRGSELTDPTITVTNLGDQGVEEVFGVIYPPQVALVGFGKLMERPWAADGMLGVRTVVRATLAADHRASDGRDGARFLARIDDLLQRPEEL